MTTILQLCPLSDRLERGLAARGDLVRWHELDDAARDALLAARAAEVRVVATGGHIGCPTALMERLPALGLIAINGVGYDKVDMDLARTRGIAVGITAGVLTEDVADLAVGLVLSLLRAIPAADTHVRAGDWPHGDRPLGRKVSGRRFGIVGLGQIGGAVARRLSAFGPVAYTATSDKAVAYRYVADVARLAAEVDVLVLACAATPATRHLIDAQVLEALGSDGYLVNVARGAVVDEAALVDAIERGAIAGAALDVFENEPDVPAALRRSARTVLTPHVASATVETRAAMADAVLANLDAYLAGSPLPFPVA